MKYQAKTLMIGRKPREDQKYKTAFVKFFEGDPLNDLPIEEIDFKNIREVELVGFNLNYLLEGNDLIIYDAGSIDIIEDTSKNILYVKKL